MTSLLLLLPFAFLNLFQNGDFKTDINIPQTNSNMEIATDSNFSNQTLNFSAGQTIYVRVTANNSGDSKSVLNLHDNLYNLLKTYQLSKINTSPYQFTTNFPAPSSSGNYSLEARVETDGSVTSIVHTIEVTGSGSDQSKDSEVNVKIENKVNTGNQVMGENDQLPTSPTPTPANQDFFSQITQFFENLWNSIWPF
jgi:hypothetical protein